MSEKKFIILVEKASETQRKLNQWLAQGYKIKIEQQILKEIASNEPVLITTVLREKD